MIVKYNFTSYFSKIYKVKGDKKNRVIQRNCNSISQFFLSYSAKSKLPSPHFNFTVIYYLQYMRIREVFKKGNYSCIRVIQFIIYLKKERKKNRPSQNKTKNSIIYISAWNHT